MDSVAEKERGTTTQEKTSSFDEAKRIALSKVEDILISKAVAHMTSEDSVSQILQQGLTTDVFEKRANLSSHGHRNWWSPWTKRFISVHQSLQSLKEAAPWAFNYEYNLIASETQLAVGNHTMILISPDVLNLTPEEWLKQLGHPDDLQKSFESGKDLDSGERNIRFRVSPREFTGLVLGDEVGHTDYYKPGNILETLIAMREEGLIKNKDEEEKFLGAKHDEVKRLEGEYWESRQHVLKEKFGFNMIVLERFLQRPLDRKERVKLTTLRAQRIVELVKPLWEKKPWLAIPIYGSSGYLYWPKNL